MCTQILKKKEGYFCGGSAFYSSTFMWKPSWLVISRQHCPSLVTSSQHLSHWSAEEGVGRRCWSGLLQPSKLLLLPQQSCCCLLAKLLLPTETWMLAEKPWGRHTYNTWQFDDHQTDSYSPNKTPDMICYCWSRHAALQHCRCLYSRVSSHVSIMS